MSQAHDPHDERAGARQLRIADPSIVMMIGAPGSGKSTITRALFTPNEVLASETFRAMVSNDPFSNEASTDAFEALHHIAATRARRRLLTVIDATHARREDRDKVDALARGLHVGVERIVVQAPIGQCVARVKEREGPARIPERAVRRMHGLVEALLREARGRSRSVKGRRRERVLVLDGADGAPSPVFTRERLHCDARERPGPFDIIGDVHGCIEELVRLLETLGYEVGQEGNDWTLSHSEGRTAVWVGDLIDRGPANVDVLRLVSAALASGTGLAVKGNHDWKLERKLAGRDVKVAHGLAHTLEQVDECVDEEREGFSAMLRTLPDHLVLDGGSLVIAHAGLPEPMHLGIGRQVREHAYYGETTGETDGYGLPVRANWASGYRGEATVVYGHIATDQAVWENNTICVDTGCCFGGALSALRWPEREVVGVPASKVWCEPTGGAKAATSEGGHKPRYPGLRVGDLSGAVRVHTRSAGWVRVDPERVAPALEVLTRYALPPKWIAWLPPTMAAPPAASEGSHLERPKEALEAMAKLGVTHVVAQRKHMGSRAVAVLGREAGALEASFGTRREGFVYTRTGRRLHMTGVEDAVVGALREGIEKAGLWNVWGAAWVILDCELMPWSAMARGLIDSHYRSVESAGRSVFQALEEATRKGSVSGADMRTIDGLGRERQECIGQFATALDCYDEAQETPVRIGPFAVVATEREVWLQRPVMEHSRACDAIAKHAPEMVVETPWMECEIGNDSDEEHLDTWWANEIGQGGEGIVVKNAQPLAHPRAPSALKVRGPEYLRIIYGPEYTREMAGLRRRATRTKGWLARHEEALGLEGISLKLEGAALHEVYRCVLAVLGLESEPVDPRL